MPSPRFESDIQDASPLFQPLKLPFSGVTVPNRFLKAAMSECQGTWHPMDISARGIPTPGLVNVFRHWGAGGWGQIQTGNIMIDGAHLEMPGNLVIPADAPFSGPRFEGFRKIATAAKAHGSIIIGQVSHPGRQAEEAFQPHPVSASDIQLHAPSMRRAFAKPHPATREDIAGFIEAFAHAAEFLDKAGFDGIEIHAAHGYLLAQFLSLTANARTDEYGGSLENRIRLLLEIAAAVQARVRKDFVVAVKINAIEYQEDGFTPQEATVLCQALEKAGVDFVELSGGNYQKTAWIHAKETVRTRENYFIEIAEDIVKSLNHMKVYTTGGFRTVGGMVRALDVVDGVGIAKAAAREPRFPLDVRSGPVKGFLKPAFPDVEFFKAMAAAGCQIRQMARNEEPVDLTYPTNCESVWQDIMAHGQSVAGDKSGFAYGHADLT